MRPAVTPIGRLWRDLACWQLNKELYTHWGRCSATPGPRSATIRGGARSEAGDRPPGPPQMGGLRRAEERQVVCDSEVDVRPPGPLDRRRLAGHRPPGPPAAGDLLQEKAFRDGDYVVYQTFLDGRVPFAYGEPEPRKREPYGFIPLVVATHKTIGLDWGDRLPRGPSPVPRLDDQASGLSDQIRKDTSPDAPGGRASAGGPAHRSAQTDRSQQTADTNANNPEPARTEQDYLYSQRSFGPCPAPHRRPGHRGRPRAHRPDARRHREELPREQYVTGNKHIEATPMAG